MNDIDNKPNLSVVENAHVIAGNNIAWDAKATDQVDVELYDTLPKILAYNAAHFPDAVAQREKEFGIWNRFTWKDFNDHVGRMALGMAELGIGQDDTVILIGDNRVEWVWGEVAAHACRAMSMGIYRDALEDEIAYLTDYTEPKIVIAEDEEQVDKFLNLEDRIPSIKYIIYTDPRGMRKYDDPRLMSLEDLEKIGQASLDKDSNAYDLLISATDTDDVAVLCTTSGTTSNPKLSMWPHRAFLGHAASYLRADPKTPDDEYLAVLPLSWVMEQMYSVAWNLISRMKVNFPEEQSTVMADLREIGPSFVLLAPRVWETIAADVRARMMDSSPWKQKMYDWGAKKALQALDDGKESASAEWLLMRALRDRLGFKNLKSAATGGAAMGPDTFKFFLSMGIPLRQLYGQTEALGAHTIHKADDVNHETVGSPMPGVELRIDNPDKEGLGEICVNHGNMMRGYYKNEEASKETFGSDGWFLTGDAGYFNDDGHLVVIDRINDLASTTSGVKFSPQYIENKLKFSTYVAEAVILGADKPYLTAMICIRYPIVSKWAEKRRLRFTTYTDLSAQSVVYEQIRKEVETVNTTLPPAQQIKKFLLLYKELDADDGELTRTRKVRRGVIADKYGDIIDRLYSDDDHVDIDTVIHFQDGSKQRIVTTLNIENLGSDGASPRPEKQLAGGR
ncbi:long-chain fatty acid--CoA ligase [Kiloniella spongiae]|uniref:long-chain fatty acid--CoA ligase n=1 Tax=Kiloniella spongiae TaxID=1489064 RepID=UPI0009E6262C|nr:long-chain fatty acid--CoA ligase [Kiloniella spongiae]